MKHFDKIFFIGLFFAIVYSCKRARFEPQLDGKKVMLESTLNSEDLREKLNKIKLLSYTFYDKPYYPAMLFDDKDSVVIVPDLDSTKVKLKFSADPDLNSIELRAIQEDSLVNYSEFVKSFYLGKYEVSKDSLNPYLLLKKDSVFIKLIDSELFSQRGRSRMLD